MKKAPFLLNIFMQATTRFHLIHDALVHLGDPAEIGISDLDQPDFAYPVTIFSLQ